MKMWPAPVAFISSSLLKFSHYSVFLLLVLVSPNCSVDDSGETWPRFDRSGRKSLPSPVSSLTGGFSNSNHRRADDSFGGNFRVLAATSTEERIPFIEPANMNTTVYVGQTASLPCIVKHLGDKTVSWIRGRDLHILTSGVHVYTSDRRVVLTHHDGKLRHLWTLNIKDIDRDDEGVYECQLNTEPKLTSLHYLHVLIGPLNDDGGMGADALGRQSPLASLDSRTHPKQVNAAQILGPSFLRHSKGDTVHFPGCLVPNTRSTTNVTWFLNDIPIERSSATRGSFRIETEVYTNSIMSKLIMFHVFKRDEGKYSCGGLGVYPASITLIVQDDSKQAAGEEAEGHGYNGRFPTSSVAGQRINLLRWSGFLLCIITAHAKSMLCGS